MVAEEVPEEIRFGEGKLQEALGRLKAYNSPDEALGTKLLEDDLVTFVGVPATEKSAETIFAFRGNPRKTKKLAAYVIVDKASEKAVNLLDILPPEEGWEVIDDPKSVAPRVIREKKRIVINEIPQFDGLKMTGETVPKVVVAGHEIGHALKVEDEERQRLELLKGLSFREVVPVILLAVSGRLLSPVLRNTGGVKKFNALDAQHDRDASAIGLKIIRKMRELGVDPLHGMSNAELSIAVNNPLKGKDFFSTGKKVHSR